MAAAADEAALLESIFGPAYLDGFAVRLSDSRVIPSRNGTHFTFSINDPGALRAAFRPPVDLNAGRAFAAGLLDIEGDVESAIDAFYRATANLSKAAAARIALQLRKVPAARLPELREARLRGRKHSLDRDRDAIGFHYDLPVEFYAAFLDRNLVYSCAYFDDGIASLEEAQEAKIDYTLRKLRLKAGERLLDIGCGWGALVIRAAKVFGARAFGVTLSKRQYEEARRRIASEGLEDRARVELLDYRDVAEPRFDKIVSVGMFEHVGKSKLPEYFRTAYRLLRDGGLFLNHGIANQNAARNGRSTGFVDRFIFPDGELVRISEAAAVAESAGFEVRDVENLREHYNKTLRSWVANLERNRDAAIAAAGEQSYRAWRLYMAGSAQGFRTGRLGLFQTLLAKPSAGGEVRMPATRRDMYSTKTEMQ